MTDDRNPEAVQRLRERVVQLEAELAQLRHRYAGLHVALERVSEIGHRALIETPNPQPGDSL